MTDIKTIGVLGAGTMGAGIAQVSAASGYTVTLYDIADDVLRKSQEQIAYFLRRAAEKGRMAAGAAENAIGRIETTTAINTLSNSDLVIEAVPERLDLKVKLLTDLEQVVPANTIFATNTSTLSITQIGAATSRADKVVGMHFFNPAPLMPLVEVVGGAATAEETVQTVIDVVKAMGKEPVRAKDVPGFLVNLVARPFYLEPMHLLEMGVVDHETADALIADLGFRMGPFRLMDLIGMDVNFASSKSVFDAYYHEPRLRPSLLQQRLVEANHLGRKSGKGWYSYEEKAK